MTAEGMNPSEIDASEEQKIAEIMAAFDSESWKKFLNEQRTAIESEDWDLLMFLVALLGEKEWVTYFSRKGGRDWNSVLQSAAQINDADLVAYAQQMGASDLRRGLRGAVRGGHCEMIRYFIDRLGGIDGSFTYGAALHGQVHVVRMFLDLNACDVNSGLEGAVEAGNLGLVDFFIERGAKCDFSEYLFSKFEPNVTEQLVHRLIKNGADDWDDGLFYSAKYGHAELLRFFMTKQQNKDTDLGLYITEEAVRCGHQDVIRILEEKGAFSLNEALVGAAKSGNIELVREYLQRGASTIHRSLTPAAETGNVPMAQLLLDSGVTVNLHEAMIAAARRCQREMLQFLMKKGATAHEDACREALLYGHPELIESILPDIRRDLSVLNDLLRYCAPYAPMSSVRFLLRMGAMPCTQTLRDCAHSRHRRGVVTLILSAFSNKTAALNDAVSLSILDGDNPNAVGLLVEKGADNFSFAFALAERLGRTNVATLLGDIRTRNNATHKS